MDMGCHWKGCDLERGSILQSSEGLAAYNSLLEAFPTAGGDEASFLSGQAEVECWGIPLMARWLRICAPNEEGPG